MLPQMNVNVPMPRIKDDPRFVGIPEIDSEEAAMIRASINDEARGRQENLLASARKALRNLSLTTASILLLTSGAVWFFESRLFFFMLCGLLHPLLWLLHIGRVFYRNEEIIEQERVSRLVEVGLCPPIPKR